MIVKNRLAEPHGSPSGTCCITSKPDGPEPDIAEKKHLSEAQVKAVNRCMEKQEKRP